jgi:hypothetical protein
MTVNDFRKSLNVEEVALKKSGCFSSSKQLIRASGGNCIDSDIRRISPRREDLLGLPLVLSLLSDSDWVSFN